MSLLDGKVKREAPQRASLLIDQNTGRVQNYKFIVTFSIAELQQIPVCERSAAFTE